MGDEENAGSMLGKFGVMMGKGAAKAGKKAAQSEAGRRATAAAISGACDGIKDDMVGRYGPQSPTSPTSSLSFSTPKSPTPQSTPAAAPPPSSMDPNDEVVEPASSYINSSYSSYNTHSSSSSSAPRPTQRRGSGPPKPSLFNRLNFLKKDSGGGRAPRPRIQKDPKDRVYKQRLASTPDWDRLPLAQTLYNFKGEMRCDLEFRKGQVIQVMTRTETQEDWWEGRLEGRVGIFPANYVRLLS